MIILIKLLIGQNWVPTMWATTDIKGLDQQPERDAN